MSLRGGSQRSRDHDGQRVRIIKYSPVLSVHAPPSGHAEIWGEAFSTATYIRKRTLRKTLDGRTRYEMLSDVKLDLAELRVFGAPYAIVGPSEISEKGA